MVLRRLDWKEFPRCHRSLARRPTRAAVALLAPATLAVLLQPLSRALVTVSQDAPAARPSRRHSLVLAGIAPSVPSLVQAPQALAVPTREIGSNYLVDYPGDIGDDFKVAGGGSFIATSAQYNVRVVYVAPGGIAEKAGVQIGDEVASLKKTIQAGSAYEMENTFRVQSNADAFIKSWTKEWQVGIIFRAMGMPQPGDQAPEFELPSSDGKKVTLADLRSGGRKVVLFFRPGKNFFNGDKDELKVFKRVQDSLGELGANVVGITNCEPTYQARQADAYNITYPLLSDQNGQVALNYGSIVNSNGAGGGVATSAMLTTDRKTFVIDADGRVKATFPVVGWEANQGDYQKHVRQIAEVLGGDSNQIKKMSELAVPKPKSIADIVAITQKR